MIIFLKYSKNFCEEILWKALYRFSFLRSLVHIFLFLCILAWVIFIPMCTSLLEAHDLWEIYLVLFRGFLFESKTEDFFNKKFALPFVAILLLFASSQKSLLFIANKFKIESFSSSEISTRSPLSSCTTGDIFLTHSATNSLTASGDNVHIMPYMKSFSGSWPSLRSGK